MANSAAGGEGQNPLQICGSPQRLRRELERFTIPLIALPCTYLGGLVELRYDMKDCDIFGKTTDVKFIT